jgi:hypothetical protein
MFDTTSISAALTSMKAIWELVRNANDAQLALRISGEVTQLQSQLLDVQQQALTLQFENQQLRAENEKFQSSVFHHSVNWKVRPEESEDGPFCPICHSEGVDMRLLLLSGVDQTGELWHVRCPKQHGMTGRRERSYAVPKNVVPPDRYFLGDP